MLFINTTWCLANLQVHMCGTQLFSRARKNDNLAQPLPAAYLSVTPVESCPLGGAMASNSSKNSTQGAAAEARENSSLTAASLWPMYLFSSSGPCSSSSSPGSSSTDEELEQDPSQTTWVMP